MLNDVRFAVRSFLKNPEFALACIVTLGLGIGANTAIFSVVDAVLLRRAPFADADRLAMIWETDRNTVTTREPASFPDYLDVKERAGSFAATAALLADEINLAPASGEPRRIPILRVTHDLLPMLGLSPLAGRAFAPSDDVPDGAGRVLISESLWEREFSRSPSAIGATLRLDDEPHTVIGVMRRGADFGVLQILSRAAYSRSFADRGERAEIEIWTALRASAARLPRSTHPLFIVGRLAPGVSMDAAQADAARVMSELERAFPENEARGAHVEPISNVVFGPFRAAFYLLLGAVALVLLVASVNVGGLLIARGSARAQEVAVRNALGARNARLVRLFLVESALMTALATLLGLAIAFGMVRAIVSLAPADIPRLADAAVDLRVLGVTIAVSTLAAIGFGLFPLLQLGRADVHSGLRGTGRATVSGRRKHLQRLLVAGELALAVVLLSGAALLIKSLWKVQQIDPGFEAARVLKAEYQLPASRYPSDFRRWPNFAEQHAFTRGLLERAAKLPGVEAAAIAGRHPLDPGFTNSFTIVGREAEARSWPEISLRVVSPSYFQTVSLPLVRGRLLLDADTTTGAPVVLINEAAARQFFPSGDPVGARMRFWGASRTIVGVVANERFHGVTAPAPIAAYAPLAQAPSASGVLLLRTAQQPSTLSSSAERVIHEIDPALAVFAVEPLDRTLARSISQRRFTTALLGGFALLALILAAVGIHGLVSYNVERRRQEIGIRMAVGAGRADVYRLILREGGVVIAGALCAGLAGALLLTRLLRTLLFDVSPADATALLIVSVVLTVVAFAATLMPARRAASTDPLAALRSE
jgi:putative ABC transport system permease protein